ncbi:DUF3810 domain-containing protein [Mangrovimonas sp. TPBH4]|uniref:DUF3810 domain-containing protein n=1 Tax=Mangrovimonas sp. TPBH4 TaxID=1645914 RepID=UPI0006B440B8|nr:DUF3810 domain-containing protein [Mangrovimonas sp. TPBH4]
MQNFGRLFIAFSILLQIAFIKLIAKFPEFVERWYSHGLYVWISKSMRFTFGWVPFSVGDLLYTLATIYILRWLYINRKRMLKDFKSWGVDVLMALSMGYLAFHILWAFNYYRLPLHESLGLEKEYTTEALLATAERLTEKVNTLHTAITYNDTLPVVMPYKKTELIKAVPKGYEVLSMEYPHLAYTPKSIKCSIYSLPLTYMGFSGYLNPFTNEAQIDGMIPIWKYPTTASHEVAHQLGYAAENEANFIGCMAAIHHPDKYFQYSGYAFALRHCLLEIYRRNPETYDEMLTKVNKGVLKNYQESRDFWMRYQNPLEPVFKTTYDNFLKANNQTDGMESYSYVVALLVNYFEANPEH